MYALKLFVVLLFVSVASSALVGGYREKEANDSVCREIAEKAMAMTNSKENGNRAIKSIDRCATQVVAGTNIAIHANVCDKEGEAFKGCVKCSMKVYRGLKSNDIDIKHFACLPLFPTDQYSR